MAQQPNAILAINSLDRYIRGPANQPSANYLVAQYFGFGPYSNDFTIQSPGALIYGYINKIIISQIQIQYNIPTVVSELNDRFLIALPPIPPAAPVYYPITIPFGFYTPEELAAALQTRIDEIDELDPLEMSVAYTPGTGFEFQSQADPALEFYFPDLNEIEANPGETAESVIRALKAYRLLGMNVTNSLGDTRQISTVGPTFLYTPYIDFYSDVLTNYQNIKDTNTSVAKPKGLIARVYLSGGGNVQTTRPTGALGSEPFVVTVDLNSPKIIRWSPDVAVPSIDFQLRDAYGDLIPTTPVTETLSTEFQMTLLCIEGE